LVFSYYKNHAISGCVVFMKMLHTNELSFNHIDRNEPLIRFDNYLSATAQQNLNIVKTFTNTLTLDFDQNI